MAPKKNKGKGKAKESGGGSSSNSKEQEGARSTHVSDVILDELGLTYVQTMIPRALRKLLLEKAPRRKDGSTRLRRVHKRHYTLNEGTFLIRIMPSRDFLPEQHLHLLFRWFDLYYLGYHCKETWYLFQDALKIDPPPRSQLFYKTRKRGGVVDLPFSTNYGSLGGFKIFVGPRSFWNLYEALMETAAFKAQSNLNALVGLCAMALPAIVFSEASRFPLLLQWVLTQTALENDNIGVVAVPQEYHSHFRSWGVDSETMFDTRDGIAPHDIEGRLGILKTPTRIEIPIIRGPHERATTSSSEEEVE